SVIAVSERGTMFDPGPSFYMEKIAVGPSAVGSIDITASATQNLRWIARAKNESVGDLTAVILEQRQRIDTYTAATDWPTDPWPAAHADLLGQVRAVADGGPPPDLSALATARATGEVITGTLAMARRQVAEEVVEDLVVAGAEHANEVLVDHLRPALEEVLAVVTTAAKVAPAEVLTASDSMLLSAKDSVRRAALALDAAAVRYAAVRTAAWTVRQLSGEVCTEDVAGLFAELRHAELAWPTHRVHVPPQRPPWEGMTPRARLLYIVTTGGEPWLPTAQEQDARLLEQYGA
ncbi:MAG: fructose-bisphosphatase class II, partial [Acidimicrobiales bacterium]